MQDTRETSSPAMHGPGRMPISIPINDRGEEETPTCSLPERSTELTAPGGCALHVTAPLGYQQEAMGGTDLCASAPLLALCLATGFQSAFALQSECLIAPPVNQHCSWCFKGWGLTFLPCLSATKVSSDHAFHVFCRAAVSMPPVAGWTEIFLPALDSSLHRQNTGWIYPGTKAVMEFSESLHVLSEAWASQGRVVGSKEFSECNTDLERGSHLLPSCVQILS